MVCRVRVLTKGRYPPFDGTGKLKQFKGMSDLKPNFDRNGKVQVSMVQYILTLGGVGAGQGLFRWLAVALGSFYSMSLSSLIPSYNTTLLIMRSMIPLTNLSSAVAVGYRQYLSRTSKL